MASTLTSWWVQASRGMTRAMCVRRRQRGSASVSAFLAFALLVGPASVARSRAASAPRVSNDAGPVIATPVLHSIAHRSTADASLPRRWLAPLDLAHPARPLSLHARVLDGTDRASSRDGDSSSGIAARGYDATAPPGSMS
jgi:hypothetical protein